MDLKQGGSTATKACFSITKQILEFFILMPDRFYFSLLDIGMGDNLLHHRKTHRTLIKHLVAEIEMCEK